MAKRLALVFPFFCLVLAGGVLLWQSGYLDLPSAGALTAARVDPVCHMEVGTGLALEWNGDSYYFCMEGCRTKFRENPGKYVAQVCPVCRTEGRYTEANSRFEATWQDKTYGFCTEEHRNAFRADAAGYFMHTMWGIPNWMYYGSIALVLVLSFGVFERTSRRGTKKHEGARNTASHISGGARVDLLELRWVRGLFRHSATRFIARMITVVLFLLILAAGLFGNQIPSKNMAPLLTWTVWWGGLIVLILYAGKAWCYVCPWDAIADWAEGLRFWGRKKEGLGLGLKWPKLLRSIWPATLLFVGLTWIEIGFGVTIKPRATAWLGLAMLGMAFVAAFVFDRKSFCRYGCLVGRVSGLYALFSPVEVRAKDREVCRTCETNSCYAGNEDGDPCPTFQYLGTMDQNTYCISCMECVKSCEQDNVALHLRPWGEDLASHVKPRSDEAYLALVMLSLTGFHGLTMTGGWRHIIVWLQEVLQVGETVAFSVGMAGIMVAPALLYAGLVWLSHFLAGRGSVGYRDYFVRYAYALLPIALFYHLAHNSEHLLMEGQKVVALASDPFGWEWNLFGTAHWRLPPLTDLPTLWVIQVFLLMVGHVYSLWVARRTASVIFERSGAAFRSQIPMLAAMILFSLMSLWLLKQPMEMRTSAM